MSAMGDLRRSCFSSWSCMRAIGRTCRVAAHTQFSTAVHGRDGWNRQLAYRDKLRGPSRTVWTTSKGSFTQDAAPYGAARNHRTSTRAARQRIHIGCVAVCVALYDDVRAARRRQRSAPHPVWTNLNSDELMSRPRPERERVLLQPADAPDDWRSLHRRRCSPDSRHRPSSTSRWSCQDDHPLQADKASAVSTHSKKISVYQWTLCGEFSIF